MRHLRPAVVLTFSFMVITGLLYPGIVTGIAQLLFPHQANGSLIHASGRIVGSELIGQQFTQPYYFHPRPSATGYDAAASGATNKGPTDRKLADTLLPRAVARARTETGASTPLPADMVTSSASGLDPHISPANAELQVARVAHARGVSPEQIRAILRQHTEGRTFGILGDPRVNVLMLNLAVDSAFPRK